MCHLLENFKLYLHFPYKNTILIYMYARNSVIYCNVIIDFMDFSHSISLSYGNLSVKPFTIIFEKFRFVCYLNGNCLS